MRWAAGSDPLQLLAAARQLATDVDSWLEIVFCSMHDYRAAGLRGDRTKLPIPRPQIGHVGLFTRFTHPLSLGRMKEDVREAMSATHVVELVPDYYVPRGQIAAQEKPVGPVDELAERRIRSAINRAIKQMSEP